MTTIRPAGSGRMDGCTVAEPDGTPVVRLRTQRVPVTQLRLTPLARRKHMRLVPMPGAQISPGTLLSARARLVSTPC